ncbi:hypothetical protein SAMN02983003_3184 [Devosia enhydra]|uniref:Uncharacterized protein n=1 Tax=Devosia enhydra TaxID=665118 RepID=A0A1K2I2M9_9HYPH|nr:hypothetical protein [Devosia enhydra]SFZ86012.1 hypothetical protein SAMN02983003_3184 [Devosia enhydra]
MPYDASKDPFALAAPALLGFGKSGRVVTPHNTNDLNPYAKAIQVVAAGNLVYLPVGNADGDNITVTSAPVGYMPPHRVRRVLATGTTATVVTVDG